MPETATYVTGFWYPLAGTRNWYWKPVHVSWVSLHISRIRQPEMCGRNHFVSAEILSCVLLCSDRRPGRSVSGLTSNYVSSVLRFLMHNRWAYPRGGIYTPKIAKIGPNY